MNKFRKNILWLAVTALVIVIDQFTKRLAVILLQPVPTVPLWQDILHLTYVENTGASFGMLKDKRWVFMVTSTILIAAIVIYLLRCKEIPPLLGVSLGMILGGGIGNMIDRVALGYVVDFIDFRAIHFAVFNGADSCITVGAVILFFYVMRSESGGRKNAAAKDEPKGNEPAGPGEKENHE